MEIARPVTASILLMVLVQLVDVLGRLTVVRGPIKGPGFLEAHRTRRLQCISENDDSALVWNTNLRWSYPSYMKDETIITDFRSSRETPAGNMTCAFNEFSTCFASWTTDSTWEMANSLELPTGPVLDRRWEDFKEVDNQENLDQYQVVETVKSMGSLSFSVRGIRDLHLLLCETTLYERDFCYWIILGGWNNTTLALRRCPEGVPPPSVYPDLNSECNNSTTIAKYEALGAAEWRTYTLKWTSDNRMVQEGKEIALYDDTGAILLSFPRGKKTVRNVTDGYYFFVRSPLPVRMRIHLYKYLHTTRENEVLTSPPEVGPNVCMEMMVALCPTCLLHMALTNEYKDDLELPTIRGATVTSDHGLPMWQHVLVNASISGSKVRLRLTSRLEESAANPFWAVAHVHSCYPQESTRSSVMTTSEDYSDDYFWPNVTCQRIFYRQNSVVQTALKSVNNLGLSKMRYKIRQKVVLKGYLPVDEPLCSEGRVGPFCAASCDDIGNWRCSQGAICYENGCQCPQGYHGPDCSWSCSRVTFGFGCSNACGRCAHSNCHPGTGICTQGCDRTTSTYFVPPYCMIGIDPPSAPLFLFKNQTHVKLHLDLQESYGLMPSHLLIYVKERYANATHTVDQKDIVYRNSTTLEAIVDNLMPGKRYTVQAEIWVNDVTIAGHVTTVTTDCSPGTSVEVVPEETSLSVTIRKAERYPCPVDWYRVTLEDVEAKVVRYTGPIENFLFTMTNLTAFTFYRVLVGNEDLVVFSKEVRTNEGGRCSSRKLRERRDASARIQTFLWTFLAPTPVRTLQVTSLVPDRVRLGWNSPATIRGHFTKYKVFLWNLNLKGCQDAGRPSPRQEQKTLTTTTNSITLTNLHPYAEYEVSVMACTSKCGPPENLRFSTDPTEIATSVVGNLRVEEENLKWDYPVDCSTISGPIAVVKLLLEGVDQEVQNYQGIRQTGMWFLSLSKFPPTIYGAQRYRVRAYIIRRYHGKYNESVYQDLIFVTRPKAPPAVRNLEIFEVDIQEAAIHLRWQKPSPPTNGEIVEYAVTFLTEKSSFRAKTVHVNEICEFWPDYFCAKVLIPFAVYPQVEVRAGNRNVSELGAPSTIPNRQSETEPDAPGKIVGEAMDKGRVNLTWTHPWRTGGRIKKFAIEILMKSTRLRQDPTHWRVTRIEEHLVQKYESKYSKELNLLPSSVFRIDVRGVTLGNLRGAPAEVDLETPTSLRFSQDLKTEIRDMDSTVSILIPEVVNDTRGSIMHVIVKGPRPCEQFSKVEANLAAKANVEYYEVAWRAATFSTEEFVGREFILGDNKIYGGATNCILHPEESYEVAVVVQENPETGRGRTIVTRTSLLRIGQVPSRPEAWAIPLVSFLVLAISGTVFYFYRRRPKPEKDTELTGTAESPVKSCAEMKNPSPSPVESRKLSRSPSPEDSESFASSTSEIPENSKETLKETEPSSLVKVKDFEDYVKNAIESEALDEQYSIFPRGQTKPWDYGKLPENKSKNRYGNLIAYDETRVILKKLPDDPYSDYINANYIRGFRKEKAYIATQGPKPNTVLDFWRMIWQEEVLIICILANVIESGKTKCEQYWPDVGRKKKYGEVTVFNARHNVFADYTFRLFHVSCGAETRKIEHLHYTAWPDHGVPMYTHSVVAYLKKLLATPSGKGPVVVHCSAGVGRTGTIILCDICLRRAAAEGVVDVLAETEALRSQRANMVDNKQQYLLAHLALMECLLSLPTTLPCNGTLLTRIKELKQQLPIQRQRLQDTSWQDEALQPSTLMKALSDDNRSKNRYPELASERLNRVYLKRYPPSDLESDYISGVYVDGVRSQSQYFASQLPLPSTLADFWRMIAELKVELIVMLQPPDPRDPTCCEIAAETGEFKPTPFLTVTTKESVDTEHYTSVKLSLTDHSQKPLRNQPITILSTKGWKPGRNQEPPPPITLVSLWQATERIPRGDGPMVTLCHDGITGCGLFLAMSFLLERMTVERECDVCLAIRAVRRSRPEFVQPLEQFEYLYDVTVTYMQYFETYANFS
ncbi:receptor-type tyrosine-protein phosphatase S isoform X2 [Orussus abietinus]|uniref:receptor-type tyrosine-protein phosphatase S isoform X2 n=1 Tax=Orussus abietinus TaxID=222816 RepID=UPI000626142F|nr:receptor-type tyrosine-protein phosphatase S isoform X2 [Orussus abietinus]